MTAYDVFLSYSHKDIDIMRRIRDDLKSSGLNVWTDENLVPGTESWKNAIESALQNTRSLIVILSPEAKQSIWVEREMDYARACRVPIIPVLAHGEDDVSSVPFELINAQRADVRHDYDAGIRNLVIAVHSVMQKSPGAPVSARHTSHPAVSSRPLDPWNFQDQMKCGVWLFLQPGKLTQHIQEHGIYPVQRTGSWMVAALGWLPFLIPVLGYSLGTVPIAGKVPLATTLSYILFLVGWIASSWLGSGDRQASIFAMIVSGICGFFIFALVGGISELQFVYSGSLRGMVGLIGIGIALGIGAGIAFTIAPGATGTLAGLSIAAVIFAGLRQTLPGTNATIAGLLMVGLAFLTSTVLTHGLQTRRVTWAHYGVAGLLIINFGMLLWVYLLGGWFVLG